MFKVYDVNLELVAEFKYLSDASRFLISSTKFAYPLLVIKIANNENSCIVYKNGKQSKKLSKTYSIKIEIMEKQNEKIKNATRI